MVLKKDVIYPIYLSQNDSEEVFKISVGIREKLDFLLRGTTDAPAVGNFAKNIALPKRSPGEYTSVDEDENVD